MDTPAGDATRDLITLFDSLPEAPRPRRKLQDVQRRCRKCEQLRPLPQFRREAKGRDGLNPWCRSCENEYKRQHWHSSQKTQKRSAEAHRLRRYGLTQAQFEAMLAGQDEKCAICLEALRPGKATHVDHCHESGRVRSLLCNPCNVRVGMFENVLHLIPALAAYVARHRA